MDQFTVVYEESAERYILSDGDFTLVVGRIVGDTIRDFDDGFRRFFYYNKELNLG